MPLPFQLIQVTAAYSNAVLVAIMPHISNFAQKLNLPIPRPVAVAQVKSFGCSPRTDHIGGRVVLTNGYSFIFDRGIVALYSSPHSYYSTDDPNRVPEFYGSVEIKKDKAVEIARDSLKKLGYQESELQYNEAPKVTPPERINGTHIARYRVGWIDPGLSRPGRPPYERAFAEVNAISGQIEMLGILDKRARRPDPVIDVHPLGISDEPASQSSGGTKLQPVSESYSNAFVTAILPEINDYIKKGGFDLKTPVTSGDIDAKNSFLGLANGDPNFFCYLKSGDRIVYERGLVIELDMHDSWRIPAPNKPPENKPHEIFYGNVNLSAEQALAVVNKTLAQLGYSAKIPRLHQKPEVVPPRKYGTNYFSRYFFNWWRTDGAGQIVHAEVDAATGKLESLGIDKYSATNLWRNPPISAPITN